MTATIHRSTQFQRCPECGFYRTDSSDGSVTFHALGDHMSHLTAQLVSLCRKWREGRVSLTLVCQAIDAFDEVEVK